MIHGCEDDESLNKAIQSFRLRLHSGLRQSGRDLVEGFLARRPKAEALGYQPCPFVCW
jgi:hypothetical protein